MSKNDGRVVSNFITQAINGNDLTIFGDGNQTRSFCYYSDLINGLIKIMDLNKPSSPINLGNPCEFTILELAELIIKRANSNSSILFMDQVSDDPQQRKPDIDFASSHLQWQPLVQIEQGIDETISYFATIL